MKISKRTLKRDIRPEHKKLRCINLGSKTAEHLLTIIDKHLTNPELTNPELIKNDIRYEFKGNKVTIHFIDKTMKQFSFIPIIAPIQTNEALNHELSLLNQPFSSL